LRIDRAAEGALAVRPDLSGGLADRARQLASLAAAVRAAIPTADVVQGGTTLVILGAEPAALRAALTRPAPAPVAPSHHAIAVRYDGPDLADVASEAGLHPRDLIARHTGRVYTALVCGFLPGFAYLGEVDDAIVCSRLAAPRKRVSRGAVGIAGKMTGVYPFASPGGWRWIGNAVEPELFDPARTPPRRIAVLDTVSFVEAPRFEGAYVRAAAHEPAGSERFEGAYVRTSAPSGAAIEIGRVAPVVTIQDALGRRGLRGDGIPWSGALDRATLEAANAAVGNEPGAAAVEIPIVGFRATALVDVVISVDGEPASTLRAGDAIQIPPSPVRAVRYLALRGGVDVPIVLGARATLAVAGLGGLEGRPLRAGDRLAVGGAEAPVVSAASSGSRAPSAPRSDDEPLEVIGAAPDPRLALDAVDILATGTFVLTAAADRLGARLDGPRVPRAMDDRTLPEPVLPGALQITGDGSVIVLGPDAATTGGYPIAGWLTSGSCARLARRRPGATVRFHFMK